MVFVLTVGSDDLLGLVLQLFEFVFCLSKLHASVFQTEEEFLVRRDVGDGESKFPEEGERGENPLIGPNLIFQGIVLVPGLEDLPLLTLPEFSYPPSEQHVLLFLLLGCLLDLVEFGLFLFQEGSGPLLSHFDFFDISVVFELCLLDLGLEVCDLPFAFHEFELQLGE